MIFCSDKTELSQRLINHLVHMEISSIYIESPEELNLEEITKQRELIEFRFQSVTDPNCFLAKLKNVVIEQWELKKETLSHEN